MQRGGKDETSCSFRSTCRMPFLMFLRSKNFTMWYFLLIFLSRSECLRSCTPRLGSGEDRETKRESRGREVDRESERARERAREIKSESERERERDVGLDKHERVSPTHAHGQTWPRANASAPRRARAHASAHTQTCSCSGALPAADRVSHNPKHVTRSSPCGSSQAAGCR